MSDQFEQKIQNINVVVKKGNIAAEDVDCIVVPEFQDCASRGGVGYAIEDAGMTAGLDAYDEIVKKNALKFGDAVITQSGKAGTKIAHVATAGADKEDQLGVVQMAVFNTLISADEQGLESIAVPELGTGIIGSLTQEQAAQAIFNAVYVFSKGRPNSSVKDVSFVVYRGSTEPAQKVLTDKSYVKFNGDKAGEKEFDMGAWLSEMSSGGKSKTDEEQATQKTSQVKLDAFTIESSHTFQDKLSQSPEFSSILTMVRNEMRIAVMRDHAKGTQEAPWYAYKILEDRGKTYDSITSSARRLVSDEFYKRHEHEMEEILGKKNLETLERISAKHEFVDYMKLDEFIFDKDGHAGFMYGTCFGSGGTIGFVGELCHGHKPQEGDRIVLCSNFIKDPEFGKLEQRNAFIYENGEYKHFYQEYSPLRDDNTVKKVVDITKAMQQKSQGEAKRDGMQR